MAIVNISGLQGSGKSYFCVESVIIPACKIGRVVYTNIPVRDDLLKLDYPLTDVRKFDLDEWVANPQLVNDVPGGSVIIIDEAWRLFPAGVKTNNAPMALKALVAEHRHRVADVGEITYSMEIVTITQDMQVDLSAYLRAKTDRTMVCRKMSALGADNRFTVDVYSRAVSAEKPRKSQHVRQIGPLKYSPKVYQYYQSQTQSESDAHGTESAQGASVVIWKKPLFWFWIPVTFAVGIYALIHLRGFFGGDAVAAVPHESAPKPAPQFVPVAELVPQTKPPDSRPELKSDSVPQPKPQPPALSSRWRVAGYLQSASGGGRVILSDGVYTRVLPDTACQRNSIGENICHVDGEMVTDYSGQSVASASSAFPSFKFGDSK